MVPPLSLPPFVPTPTVMLTTLPDAAAQAATVPPPRVCDQVVRVGSDAFVALKKAAKANGVSLNAPFMTAFLAAVADAAKHQQPELVRALSNPPGEELVFCPCQHPCHFS
jgi:hypothetical protein